MRRKKLFLTAVATLEDGTVALMTDAGVLTVKRHETHSSLARLRDDTPLTPYIGDNPHVCKLSDVPTKIGTNVAF